MGIEVTSWFVEQTKNKNAPLVRKFTMAGSDHTDKVVDWPIIRRDVYELKSLNISVGLDNVDRTYNEFYTELYTLNASCHIEVGFTHPESGDELVRVYTGRVKTVSYPNQKKAVLSIYDRIYDVSQVKVGSTDEPVDFTNEIPSDIAWTLVTCYGPLSNVASTSNPDIDYEQFNEWAASFSADNIVGDLHAEGEKIPELLTAIIRNTDSYAWIEGYGKFAFTRFSENSSLDFSIEEGEYSRLVVNLDGLSVINKQYVSHNYSVESDYWTGQSYAENTVSVNSFNLHENVLESPIFWYQNSSHAYNLASRRIARWATPPRKFRITTPLFGLHREPSDALRFVSSFYTVTSDQGWRISEQQLNLKACTMEFATDEGLVAEAFYLDSSELDGDDQLL